MPSRIDPTTLERLVPDLVSAHDTTGQDTLKLHLERYAFAAAHITGGAVLDIACGVGYGSRYLKDRTSAATVTGVDLSDEAIAYATQLYEDSSVTFQTADALAFQGGPFDAVISLETIEHLPDPAAFVRHAVRDLLAPGGLFVGSVPVTPSMDANPYHLSDFTPQSFRRLLADEGLHEVAALPQVQPFNPFAVALRTEVRMQSMRKSLLSYYAKHPRKMLLRLRSTVIDGFNNKYLTLACRKEK